jgi:HTH-type transcriptional regulator/antitoxin HipB
MNYPIDTPAQARAVLRALRQARGLSQAQAGQLLGVSQKRIARIEAAPDRTGLDQITKLITLLGGRVVIEDVTPATASKTKSAKAGW